MSTVVNFAYTGTQQTFTVPTDVYALTLDVVGAGHAQGRGGRVQTTLSVVPGNVLYLFVGGISSGSVGGYNGGGQGYSQGGSGATDIRLNGTALANRVVVAGGGGGNNAYNSGGNGGGTTADAGGPGDGGIAGGGPGTPSAGGYQLGGLGTGGASAGPQAGGGGGGYYGGGGGQAGVDSTFSASYVIIGWISYSDGRPDSPVYGWVFTGDPAVVGGSGGGGSSYAGTGTSSTTHTKGYANATSNGSVSITYSAGKVVTPDVSHLVLSPLNISVGKTPSPNKLAITVTTLDINVHTPRTTIVGKLALTITSYAPRVGGIINKYKATPRGSGSVRTTKPIGVGTIRRIT